MTHDDVRDLLFALRGMPTGCDFCMATPPVDDLHPEEGGEWVCNACLARWDAEERDRAAQGGTDRG